MVLSLVLAIRSTVLSLMALEIVIRKGMLLIKHTSAQRVTCSCAVRMDGGTGEMIGTFTCIGCARVVFPLRAGTSGPYISWALLQSDTLMGQFFRLFNLMNSTKSSCPGQPMSEYTLRAMMASRTCLCVNSDFCLLTVCTNWISSSFRTLASW